MNVDASKKAFVRNSHCSFCGTAFQPDQPWPRRCEHCGRTTYLNPIPVSVLLCPVVVVGVNGLIAVRRGIQPHIGQIAIPGGFIVAGETWQQAGVREFGEELGIFRSPEEVTLFDVQSAPDGTLLVFGRLTTPLDAADLPPFVPNDEVTERVILTAPTELAFPLHTRVVARYFERLTS